MTYDGWLVGMASRFQEHFDRIQVEENFEYGVEFEVALCKALRELLPARVGICRGYVVGEDGKKAGDDIVLFDQHRFPTLRPLGDDLSVKQNVPAAGVLAYIEAKHTLYLEHSPGQSIDKAVRQIAGVKSIHRAPVPMTMIDHHVDLKSVIQVAPGPGSPDVWNPWYGLIMARNILVSPQNRTKPTPEQFAEAVLSAVNTVKGYPDLMVAGSLIALPAYMVPPAEAQLRRFWMPENSLAFFQPESSMGTAAAHLLWAIEYIKLGSIDWPKMFNGALGQVEYLITPPK